VADSFFEHAPFAFVGRLKRLHFKNLRAERPAFKRSPEDDYCKGVENLPSR
jgi:hypothetical protein